MNKRKNQELIQEALNTALSGLQDDPWLVRRVIAEAKKGEKKVKRKIPFGLVLAIILALVTATALAVGLTNYFNGFAKLEGTYGEYESWPQNAKVELVELMLESDVFSGPELESWNHALSQQEREAAAEQMLQAYFENMASVDTYNVMLRELGRFEDWPQAEKALYSSLLIEYGKQKPDWPVYLMPEESDIQQEEAILRAKQVLAEKFLTEERIAASDAHAAFLRNVTEYGDAPVWIIEFSNPEQYSGVYRVVMAQDGELLLYDAPLSPAYPSEFGDILVEAKRAVPGKYDKSAEEIEEIARESIREIGDFENRMQSLEIDAHFIYHERFQNGCEPVWLVFFMENGEPMYKMLFNYEGEYMDGVPTDAEFERTLLRDAALEEKFDPDFRYYTVEEKAEFSRTVKPIVDAYIETHPYYPNHQTLLYQATRRIYGVPGEGDIPQTEALRRAKEQILLMGARKETIESRRVVYTFDVTEPNNPIWKVMIYHVSFDVVAEDAPLTDRLTYQVIMDAKTGAVLECYDNTQDGMTIYNM